MKIIGEAANERLLIEATRDEVANLLGAYSQYHLKEAGLSYDDLKPGKDINVRGAWEKLYWLEHRGDEFNPLREALQRALKEIEQAKPLFSQIKAA